MAARAPHADAGELGSGLAAASATGRSAPAAPKPTGPRTPGAIAPTPGEPGARPKSLTIGSVCKALAQEFPEISISKIRYLEDQKLLTPRRTPGGYRLYTQGDGARLRTN